MQVAVITGSSSGVGLEAACDLAGRGFHVVFACRSPEKAAAAMEAATKRTPTAKTTFLQLDTAKMASVKRCAEEFRSKFDRLDVLVNNAGSGYFLKKDRVTEEGLEAFFATNYLGHYLLTKLLLDILKRSNGRVVNVTSIEHWEASYNFEKVTAKTEAASYPTSKLMMMLFAFELCQREGIPTAAVNPGAVNSGIWWYLRGWKKFLWSFISSLFLLNTWQGSQTIIYAATVDQLPKGTNYYSPYRQRKWCPKYSDTLGPYNGPGVAQTDPRAQDKAQWSKLWEFSEQKVKPYL